MSLPPGISRREAVRRLTILCGGAMSSTTLTALLSGCRAEAPGSDRRPEALTTEQYDILGIVVDRIIPPTDTPGASEVGVPAFIDRMLGRWAGDDLRTRVLEGIDALGPDFLHESEEAQMARLTDLDEDAVAAREEGRDPLPFFATVKEWTLIGYYTSEVGATQELRWLAIPGRWDADIPLDQVGRAWL